MYKWEVWKNKQSVKKILIVISEHTKIKHRKIENSFSQVTSEV